MGSSGCLILVRRQGITHILVHRFLQADGHRLHLAHRHAAIGEEPLVERDRLAHPLTEASLAQADAAAPRAAQFTVVAGGTDRLQLALHRRQREFLHNTHLREVHFSERRALARKC